MTREELIKAAEEYLTRKRVDKLQELTDDNSGVIDVDAILNHLIRFHLHQTKKMLEGWTDERIKKLIDIGGKMNFEFANGERWEAPADYTSEIRGAKQFRDELLKQLEG